MFHGSKTENQYWDSVRSIAEEIKEEYPDPDDDDRHDRIHEDTDGSEWIIYYANNDTVLSATKNEPDADEVAAMVRPGATWQDMRMTAAYLAMQGDIHQELRKLDKQDDEVVEGLKEEILRRMKEDKLDLNAAAKEVEQETKDWKAGLVEKAKEAAEAEIEG